jgi:hypothetical protein
MDMLNGLIISAHPPHPKPPLPVTFAYYDMQLDTALAGTVH